jgi:hypothetical protein
MNSPRRYADATATMRSLLLHRRSPVLFHIVTDRKGREFIDAFFRGFVGGPTCWDMRFIDGPAQIRTFVQPFLRSFGLKIAHYAGEAAMLKLFMPYILKDVDEVIVLDADVVLTEDIGELWQLLRTMPQQRSAMHSYFPNFQAPLSRAIRLAILAQHDEWKPPLSAPSVKAFKTEQQIVQYPSERKERHEGLVPEVVTPSTPPPASEYLCEGKMAPRSVTTRTLTRSELLASEQPQQTYSKDDYRSLWSGLEVRPPSTGPLIGMWISPNFESGKLSPATNALGGPFFIGGVYLLKSKELREMGYTIWMDAQSVGKAVRM